MFKSQGFELIAKIWKAARMLEGYTQVEIAHRLEMSQASVSQIERGLAEPSASQWYFFCQMVKIDAHKTLELGYIDGKKNLFLGSYPRNIFKVPERYTYNQVLKVRDIIDLVHCIHHFGGESSWKNFKAIYKVDDYLFLVYDFDVSINLFSDLISFIADYGFSLNDYFGSDVSLSHSKFSKKQDLRSYILNWIESQKTAQMVFNSSLSDVGNSFKLEMKGLREAQALYGEERISRYLDYKICKFERDLNSYFQSDERMIEISRRSDSLSIFFPGKHYA